MTSIPFYLVDVFAERRYAGNQLGVFRHAAHLTAEQMQRIAKELNFSETTFILADEPRDGGYDVRIFTPESEIPFAGHPTLGTAHVIRREIIAGRQQDVGELTLNLGVGPIPVRWERDGSGLMWMTQQPPAFRATFEPADVAELLGLDAADIDDRYPIQEVSTGLPSLIVPLKTLSAVQASRTNRALLPAFERKLEARALLVFAPEALEPGHDLHARVFVDSLGVPEDPATGSAAGNLAGYLARYRCLGPSRIDVKMEQGYAIGRPSLLYLRAEDSPQGVRVEVGGKAFSVAHGEWPL
ncbi:phenazine biosynthesis protein [Gordoniibacillus kamchatkensis]|uniref:Phenazine biosynthesis protein n=1 Tax=Gordoniibacillus kamchatkensis TaxID=1590651 RepID=A0ABR5AE28_9BACL|nr:PhzF family phenazine biosynthesis protein [Paenibacillus sp. VKM B-2647]KIL39200.1 phenazine biosynthesis protein [Paenibacillus sp. VKM B-2647]